MNAIEALRRSDLDSLESLLGRLVRMEGRLGPVRVIEKQTRDGEVRIGGAQPFRVLIAAGHARTRRPTPQERFVFTPPTCSSCAFPAPARRVRTLAKRALVAWQVSVRAAPSRSPRSPTGSGLAHP